jgi:hypothetical protein
MERVSDERLDELVAVVDARMYVVTLVADETQAIMHELLDRRAAEREQAAPEPRKLDEVTCTITVNPGAYEAAMAVAGSKIAEFIRAKQPKPRKPAKWERRLEMMRGTLEKEEIGERRWQCSLCFEGHTFYGPTAKAAVEAAWKAWKEEQGE